MTERVQPTDLELAALISSKICHDVIGPISAINNGLEIFDEEEDVQSKNYALDVIRNVTVTASARLQFARFAFGASGSAGSQIDLGNAEALCRGIIGSGKQSKHKLIWRGAPGAMAKDKVKLLLNLIAAAPTAIPRGGDIEVNITGTLETPSFVVRCRGVGARPPQYLGDFVNGPPPPIDAMSIQAYYTLRLAVSSRMRLADREGWRRYAADGQAAALSRIASTGNARIGKMWLSLRAAARLQGNLNSFDRPSRSDGKQALRGCDGDIRPGREAGNATRCRGRDENVSCRR